MIFKFKTRYNKTPRNNKACNVSSTANSCEHTDITCANVVGYVGRDVGKEYTIVPVQFEQIGADTIDLLQYMSFPEGITPVTCYGDWTEGTQILVQNGGGYTSYIYAYDAFDLVKGDFAEGWAAEDTSLIDSIPVTIGCSVWIYNPSKTLQIKLNFAGQVLGDGSKTLTPGSEYTLVCNPYPMLTNFKDMILTEGVEPVSCYGDWSEGRQILIQNGGGYTSYVYAFDAFDLVKGDFAEGWAAEDTSLVDPETTILANPGEGFWFYNPKGGSAKITFEK